MIPNAMGYGTLIRWGIGLAVVVLLCGGLVRCGMGIVQPKLDSEKQAHQLTKDRHAEVLARLAEITRVAAEKAAAASVAVRRERTEIDARHQEALTHAQRESDRLRADLRAGTVRLQDRWACPVPGAGEGGAAAGAREADPAGRFDSLARVHGAAATDAAVIDWLWDSWMADRRAVIAGGCATEGD